MLSKKDIVLKTLLDELNSGKLQPGDFIPSRNQLMRRFHCSRTVIEKAVARLTEMGRLAGRQGKGTIVRQAPEDQMQNIRRVNVISPYDAKSFRSPFSCLLLNPELMPVPVEMIPVGRAEAECENLCQSDALTVFINPGYGQLAVMNFLKSRQIPQLLINREFDGFDRIYTDTLSGFRQGLEKLNALSDAPLSLIALEPELQIPYQTPRLLSFYRALTESRTPFIPENTVFISQADIENGLKAAEKIFTRLPAKIAVVNSDLILPVINLAGTYGLVAGKDYYLLAFEYLTAVCNMPGVVMIRQRYDIFFEELKRFLALCNTPGRPVFISAVPPEICCAE